MLPPSLSLITALYILDPLSALSFLPHCAPMVCLFFLRNLGETAQRFHPGHVPDAFFASLNMHLIQTRFSIATPTLIRSNFPASVIPLVIWIAAPKGHSSSAARPKLDNPTCLVLNQAFWLSVHQCLIFNSSTACFENQNVISWC